MLLKYLKQIKNDWLWGSGGKVYTDSSQANPSRIIPDKSIAKKALYGQISASKRKRKLKAIPQLGWSVGHSNSGSGGILLSKS